MNSKQWFFVALVPIMFSLVNFFMFSSTSMFRSSILWFFSGYILFLALLTFKSKSFFFSKQGFVSGLFNLVTTVILLFLYSFNFLTNVFPFLAAGIIFFFIIDYLVSRDKNFNLKMILGVLIVFAGLLVTQFNGVAFNLLVISVGIVLMALAAVTNFTLLYQVDDKNLASRVQSFLLPALITPLLLLFPGFSVFNFNGLLAGFISAVGFLVFCYALIEIYGKKRGLWSRNLINIIGYTDIIILNVFAILLFQGKYTLNGLVGSIVVFMGIVVFILSEPSN